MAKVAKSARPSAAPNPAAAKSAAAKPATRPKAKRTAAAKAAAGPSGAPAPASSAFGRLKARLWKARSPEQKRRDVRQALLDCAIFGLQTVLGVGIAIGAKLMAGEGQGLVTAWSSADIGTWLHLATWLGAGSWWSVLSLVGAGITALGLLCVIPALLRLLIVATAGFEAAFVAVVLIALAAGTFFYYRFENPFGL
ncbi:hypothetical protein [Rhizobium halophytocola]|uniref:Uncharacterized protein n=1 Tax=Rhizobium halophytocola TaxID=735519 RepID=A0ABS4E5R9_9HYPH|nr:hypothetical protein [Rhizobium halophytocola]MBP1853253.1 hypothetical protein [Rhizobium halophytocola]